MKFDVVENKPLTKNVYQIRLYGDNRGETKPGQFVQFQIPGFYLRRPISIYDWTDSELVLIYKVIGQGTETMANMKQGETVDLLLGLGNGFDVLKKCSNPVLIGGGVGIPPLYGLCKELLIKGKSPFVILGFNTKEDVFLVKNFEELGVQTFVTTVDGTYGEKGFVTTPMSRVVYDYFYTCGPEPMLKSVYQIAVTDGQLSFEERMACGFGACMGCSCKTRYGPKRICKDGPVLNKREVIW